MPRPHKIIRPRTLHIVLPEDILARLELYLYSPSQQRIPYGAYTEFFSKRIEEFFKSIGKPHV